MALLGIDDSRFDLEKQGTKSEVSSMPGPIGLDKSNSRIDSIFDDKSPLKGGSKMMNQFLNDDRSLNKMTQQNPVLQNALM